MDFTLRQDIFQRCEGVLRLLQGATQRTIVEKARTELKRISSEMENPPKLTVAVYGDTGSGKSSLLNALLDQPSTVPTAGMGMACTSVVIKIEENGRDDDFEANIEFLTKEEWEREISVLTKDLKVDKDDTDNADDIYESARAMVSAVYGDFEDDDLEQVVRSETDVTVNLGTVLELTDTNARSLQDHIWRFIETTDDGFQYWPIVKQVILRVPTSDLCQSGTELIDLPGVGDSNPARDNVAKKYLQTCDVLMIVTKIQRAVDNKTAKNVLGDTMFRQVQMDHRKTVLACTQTDDVKPAEVIRKLKLSQSSKWTEESQKYTEEEKQLQLRLSQLRKGSQAPDADRAMLNEQETEIHRELDLVRGRLNQLKKEKSSTCAVERNNYVKRTIQNKASTSDDAMTDMQVFCVSSADYIKLSNLLTCDEDDDKPPVFISAEQTEIPDLRNFLRTMAKEKQDRKAEFLRKEFKGVLSGLVTYLSNSEQGGVAVKAVSEQTLERNLTGMKNEIQNVVKEFETFVLEPYHKYLDQALEDATVAAEEQAKPKSDQWARPVNRKHRERGGLAFGTYKATVHRYGQFTSLGIGCKISMNEDLANPFFRTIGPKWQEMFSQPMWDEIINKRLKDPITNVITNCSDEILQSVKSLGFDVSALTNNLKQLKTDMTDKLTRLDTVWMIVQRQQREITAHITGHVQNKMKSTYELCQEKEGPGSFRDMKTIMALRVDQLKDSMFRNIKETVKKSLDSLKDDVIGQVNYILDDICDDARRQIEPLWQAYGGAEFLENVRVCKQKLGQLNTEIFSAPNPTTRKRQSEDQNPLGVEKVPR